MTSMKNAALSLLICLLCPLAAHAGDEPFVLFESGGKTVLQFDQTITVQSELMQIQIGPRSILSVKKGDEFRIRQAGPEHPYQHDIFVNAGQATLHDLSNDQVVAITAGSTLTGPVPCGDASPVCGQEFRIQAAASTAGTDNNPALGTPDGTPKNLPLSSFVMTKQQDYLNSLQLEARDINNLFGSILRAFAPTPRPPPAP